MKLRREVESHTLISSTIWDISLIKIWREPLLINFARTLAVHVTFSLMVWKSSFLVLEIPSFPISTRKGLSSLMTWRAISKNLLPLETSDCMTLEPVLYLILRIKSFPDSLQHSGLVSDFRILSIASQESNRDYESRSSVSAVESVWAFVNPESNRTALS